MRTVRFLNCNIRRTCEECFRTMIRSFGRTGQVRYAEASQEYFSAHFPKLPLCLGNGSAFFGSCLLPAKTTQGSCAHPFVEFVRKKLITSSLICEPGTKSDAKLTALFALAVIKAQEASKTSSHSPLHLFMHIYII